MNIEKLARSYYQHVNAKDLEGLLALFTDDAAFSLPDGRKVEGKDALRTMYIGVFERGGPQPQPVRIIADSQNAAAEVAVTLANGSVLHMASFFRTDGKGLFSGVAVYRQG